MLTLAICIGGITLGYGATWALIIKSRKIINTIDKNQLHDAREIVHKLKL